MSLSTSERDRTDFLDAVPIFAGLSAEMRAELASHSTWTHVSAGDWLFREGEPGDSLYVVRSGRLEIVLESADGEVARALARGAVVGELSLITGAARSAAVRARRDSELLRVSSDHFAELLRSSAEFGLALTRELGRQLQASRSVEMFVDARPATIAVVPLEHGVDVRELSGRLIAELAKLLEVAALHDQPGLSPSDYAALLDSCESDNAQVVLVANPVEDDIDEWTSFCLRQADRVVGLSPLGQIPRWVRRHPELAGCELVSLAPRGQGAMEPWLDALAPRAHTRLPQASSSGTGVGALARRLAGRSLGLVLSGGGARGFAHIGVLEELERAGVAVDRVGGCSMGAYVGGMFAMGLTADQIRERCREEFVDRNPLSDYTVPRVSLVRGQRAEAMLRRSFGEATIEDLERQYFCVACDLFTGELVVHRRGLMYEAVGTSMCLPGVFPPVPLAERLLVDGGVLDNLPVEPMSAAAEGPVIATDVTAEFRPPEVKREQAQNMRGRLRRRRINAAYGRDAPLPRLKETLVRAITIGSIDTLGAARKKADLLITPETGAIGLLDFRQLDRMVEAGRVATREALAAADLSF